MSKVGLSEQQRMILDADRVTTMRVYVAAAAKRAVVVEEDDVLAKADIEANPEEVSNAHFTELKTWFDKTFFHMQDISKASNIMTSRYVCTLKFMKDEKGEMERAIILRLVLRGSMDLEAFDVEAFSGTARRSSQRMLASTAACKKQWTIASLDISMAFLNGLTYQDLAEATGKNAWCALLCCLDRPRCVGLPRIRTLRRVKALLVVLDTRHWHQRHTARFRAKAQKGHPRFWFPTRVLRRGVRDEQQPAHGQTC
eukprot:6601749-Pyramimonas_sp.AAC.2